MSYYQVAAGAYDYSLDCIPHETACIQFEAGEEEAWREVSRSVTSNKGLVKFIRTGVPPEHTVDTIWFEYYDISSIRHVKGFNFDLLLEVYKEKIAKIPNVISKKCITRSKNEYFEELRIKDEDGKIIHELNRCVLTGLSFHRLNFSSKAMTPELRAKWIDILNKAQIIPYMEAYGAKGISIFEKLSYSVTLGGYFDKWVEINRESSEDGITIVGYCPVPVDKAPVGEMLEIMSFYNRNENTIDDFIDLSKKIIMRKTTAKVNFEMLECSPSEVVFKYHYPLEEHTLNVVVRSILTGEGYFSFSYKLALKEELSSEDAAEMVEKLKMIKTI